MTARHRALLLLGGAVAGIFGGLFGVGGGVILIAVLVGPLGLTQHQGHGTSLAVIMLTALTSMIVYASHGNVAWTTGILTGVASILTAPIGARLTGKFSHSNLKRVFSVFLVLVAIRLLWTLPPPAPGAAHQTHWLLGLAIGAGAGLFSGFMGVGGGIVAVPAFLLLLHMPQQLAQGTSLLMILGAASSGAIAHSRRGNVVMAPVPWLAIGAAAAGPLASWWAQHLPRVLLARAFAVFLIANAVHGWLTADRAPRPKVQAARSSARGS